MHIPCGFRFRLYQQEHTVVYEVQRKEHWGRGGGDMTIAIIGGFTVDKRIQRITVRFISAF